MLGHIRYTLAVLSSKDLTLFTNGKSDLTKEQKKKLEEKGIGIVKMEIQVLNYGWRHGQQRTHCR
jgi:hypothetical protein